MIEDVPYQIGQKILSIDSFSPYGAMVVSEKIQSSPF